jgi:hypothetical protein
MTAGLWSQIQAGSPPAVTAAIRVSEPRSPLLGLDVPVLTRSELSDSPGVYSDRLAADRELFIQLAVQQLEVLAAESQALVDKAMAMVRANALMQGASTAARAAVHGAEEDGEPAESPRAPPSTMRSQAPFALTKRVDACSLNGQDSD